MADLLSQSEKIKRMEQISSMLLTGMTTRAIAEKLGLSQSAVARAKLQAEAIWLERMNANIDEIKSAELAKLDWMEGQVLEQWERSKDDHQRRVVEEIPSRAGGNPARKAKIETAGQCGDPRYIVAWLQIMDRRAKLLGLDKPQKIAATDPEGQELPAGPVLVALPAQLGADEWARTFSKPRH